REFVALPQPGAADLRRMKRMGFSDRQLAALRGTTEQAIRDARWRWGVHPAYKTVDTCAGEFPSRTPYLYGSYDDENESEPLGAQGIVILGSGPNRIGQGVEFDYCCVRAGLAFRELGFKTIMINSNPETVSTDFDISDKLYFEPLTLEDVLEIVRLEQPKGVVVQLGGQTPLKLAKGLEAAGIPILGTTPDAIDIAEDRRRVEALADGRRCVIGGVMQHIEEAGIHSGDSACVLPPYLIDEPAVEEMRRHTRSFAQALGVVGLINAQYAVKDGVVYVLEVNPRGSRTVPFVSKATGVSLAKFAAAVMVGQTLDQLGVHDGVPIPYVAVKEAVFPFSKLP